MEEEPAQKSWVGIPRDCQRIPEAYSTAKTGLRQLKGKHQKNTRNKEQMSPFQVSEIQQEKERKT